MEAQDISTGGHMKQRIRVVGIVKTKDGILVLKRSRGRSENPVFWELPTDKIKFGEQPEEAITRALSDFVKITAVSVRLKDVITFLALEGASRLSNLYIIYEIGVEGRVKPEPEERYTAYKFIKDFAAPAGVHLNEASLSVLEIIEGKLASERISARSAANSVTIYVDGASRGNPGPSGVGYHVVGLSGETMARGGQFIGFATSRMAEYCALKNGVEVALELGLSRVKFVSDSLMVVNQMKGIFSVKNQDILPIYQAIQKKLTKFESVSFVHVNREDNPIADYEANAAIDDILKRE
ncbi:reverse transcriptase-like protein [Candidatus Saccharibacteria bacterium]|nr:reverse transcriptase-like protein [Candidatus Saccharibacteria bacterium]